ncbi:MAG: YCF48-related protein [bacterium]
MKKLAILLIPIIALMVVYGCTATSTSNNAPVIMALTASPSSVQPEGTVTLSCDAHDADGDVITYAWSASAGTLSSTSASLVTWTAPAAEATYQITVTISDGSALASDSVNVMVSSSATTTSTSTTTTTTSTTTTTGWVAQDSGIIYNLNDVFFIDENEGWAVGSSEVIIHTEDGGENWEVQNVGTVVELNAVDFVDELHGWAAGDNGIILATTDGGSTWTSQESGLSGSDIIWDIDFYDENNGWIVGQATFWYAVSGMRFRSTTDGGATWQIQQFVLNNQLVTESSVEVPNVALYDIKAGDSGGGTVVGGDGTLIRYLYLFYGWVYGDLEDVDGFPDNANIWAIDTTNSATWLVGYSNMILKSTDGFASDITEQTSGLNNMYDTINRVDFINDNTGWALSNSFITIEAGYRGDGYILHTSDSGDTWETATCEVGVFLNGLHFPTSSEGWVVGNGGKILKLSR